MTSFRTNSLTGQQAPRAVLWRGVWTALAFHVAFALFVLIKPYSGHIQDIFTDTLEALGGLLATALCFLGIKRRGPRAQSSIETRPPREIWMTRFFGVGLLCYGIGEVFYTVQDLRLHAGNAYFNSYDIWYMASYPFLMAGIVLLPPRPMPASARPRMVLDALMSMAALVTFSWYFLLGPMLVQKHVSLSAKFVAMSYPILDLASIFCMLMLGQHAMPRGLRRVANIISVGLVITAISDSVTSYQSLHAQPVGGYLMELGWSLGYSAVALAISAVRLFPDACRQERDNAPRPAVLWQSLLPYAFLPLVGGLILGLRSEGTEPGLALGVYVGASLLVILVLLRQILAIFENRDLNVRLADFYQDTVENARCMGLLNEELVSTQEKLHDNLAALTLANERLEHLADTDAVSGLLNHRGMAAALEETQRQARGQNRPYAVLFLDVDHFKAINDNFGHPAGDCALREIALVLREQLRPLDILGRWGGEEFLALLPGTDCDDALAVAETMRTGIAAREFSIAGGLQLTCSIGLASFPRHASDWAALVDAADRGMYMAKSGGRNQVRAAADPDAAMHLPPPVCALYDPPIKHAA